VDREHEIIQVIDGLNQIPKICIGSELVLKLARKIAHIGIWELDLKTKLLTLSDEALILYGLKIEKHELSLKLVQQYVHIEDRNRIDKALERLIKGKAKYDVNFRVIKANNSEVRYMHSVAEVEYDDSGKKVKILGIIQDVTERVLYTRELENKSRELTTLYKMITQNEQRLRHIAYHDYTTDLPNRNLFLDRLKNAIKLSENNNSKIFIVFLDLDTFKIVNDALGYVIGDELLIETSKRLLKCIDQKDTVARINGDEFSLLHRDVNQEPSVFTFLERLISVFKEPFRINENMINLTASIGVSIYPEDGDTEEELMHNAKIALYRAKGLGKNKYQLYNSKMKEDLWQKINIELLLMKAINNNEFVIYYQPQYTVGIEKLKLRGFEALIRWNSPELGFLTPMDFIPIAEQTGLITQIGEWVLNSACTTCKKLEDKYGRVAIKGKVNYFLRSEYGRTIVLSGCTLLTNRHGIIQQTTPLI
jgi:diguanylate cyclase (GGDEF)-like protein/PAS domain S-box-containing protein